MGSEDGVCALCVHVFLYTSVHLCVHVCVCVCVTCLCVCYVCERAMDLGTVCAGGLWGVP